ncbi:MAG: hypothetical protein M5U22_06540 [Thermoleophilia bacterium]|nr:hypothetical protein [Thermoleophilia bacterium]
MRTLTLSDIPVVGILSYMGFMFLCVAFVFLDNRLRKNRKPGKPAAQPKPTVQDLKAYQRLSFLPRRRTSAGTPGEDEGHRGAAPRGAARLAYLVRAAAYPRVRQLCRPATKKLIYLVGGGASAIVLLYWTATLSLREGRWLALPLLGLMLWNLVRHRHMLRLSDPQPVYLQPRPGQPLFWAQQVIFAAVAGFLVHLVFGTFDMFLAVLWFLVGANTLYATTVSWIFVEPRTQEVGKEG